VKASSPLGRLMLRSAYAMCLQPRVKLGEHACPLSTALLPKMLGST
jgi:hypothetical protein